MSFLLALLQVPGQVQPPPPPPFPLLNPQLGLDATQRQAIESILARQRDAMQSRHKAWDEAREALHKGMGDPQRPVAELETLLRQEAEAHRAQVLAAHAVLVEAAQVLRPDQREALKNLRPPLPQPRGPRPEGRPEGRPEPHR